MPEQRPVPDVVLGIDLGTTNVKAVLMSVDGRVVAEASRPIAMLQGERGAAEQDPNAWWASAVHAVRAALAEDVAHDATVRVVGVAGQMHGSVLLDARGAPVRAAITWADTRGSAAVRMIERVVGRDRVVAITGSAPALGLTAASLLWVRDNDPEAWRRVATVLLPKDMLRLRLTGECATDPSDASGTLLYDLTARGWSHELLDALGLPPEVLPPIRESTDVAGTLTRDAAEELGIPAGVAVVTGAGDTPAAALAVGAVAPETASVAPEGAIASISLGTGGQVVVGTARPLIDALGRVQALAHALPRSWYLMAATLSAGSALAWLAGVLRPAETSDGAVEELDRLAAGVPPGARGVSFAPYLRGERSPHLHPAVRAAFVGLDLAHGPPELARAVMEGVAFALHDGQRVIDELGAPVERIVLSGGGARSETWARIVAGVFGVPVERRPRSGGSAVGAALLAAIGGATASGGSHGLRGLGVLSGGTPHPRVDASAEEIARYAELGARSRAIHPHLRALAEHAGSASATENRFPQ